MNTRDLLLILAACVVIGVITGIVVATWLNGIR
jgi:cation transporter-like permease